MGCDLAAGHGRTRARAARTWARLLGYGLGAYVFNYTNATGQLDQKTWGLGGNYLMGQARLYAHYMKAQHDKSAGGATQQSDAVIALAVAYPVTPVLSVKAAYYRDSGSDVGGVAGRDGAGSGACRTRKAPRRR